jgi:quinoprotein glucose dehydrogenase
LPIEDLYPKLAAILPKLTSAVDPDATVRRALSAAYRLGSAEQAKLVLAAASNPNLSLAVRQEAVFCLRDWSDPPPRDRVDGKWRPLRKRDPGVVRGVVSPAFEKLLGSANGALLNDVVALIGPLKLDVSNGMLDDWVADGGKAVSIRVAALRVLADRKSPSLRKSVNAAIEDSPPLLRAEARDVLAATDPAVAADLLSGVLIDTNAPTVERQRAIAALARIKTANARRSLDAWGEKLAAGEVAAELQLDSVEALRTAPSPSRDTLRTRFEAKLPSKFAVSLTGGDAERGQEIFFGHAAAQCVRCHVVKGTGGAAGPDLSKVAERYPEKTRAFFLESLLTPSAKIAPGFGTVTLNLADGRTVSGVLAAEDKTALTVQYADGKKERIAVEDVERRSAATSPMPAVDQTLSPREVRDVIEYLTTLK